jgi:NADPH:quinone reductase
VGSAAVQIARAAGMRVVGSAGSAQGLTMIEQEGVHLAVNHREPDYLEKAMAFTEGKGFDVILEMNVTQKLADDVNLVGTFGRIIVIGGTNGSLNFDPTPLLWKGASVIGLYMGLASSEETQQIHAAIYQGLDRGELRPQVSQSFSLADVAKAHEAVHQSSSAGKIVLMF